MKPRNEASAHRPGASGEPIRADELLPWSRSMRASVRARERWRPRNATACGCCPMRSGNTSSRGPNQLFASARGRQWPMRAPATAAPIRPPRVKMLLILHSDAFVEVYSEPHVNVRVVQRVHATLPTAEALSDEVIECQLPQCYRRLFLPRNLRAAGQCRRVTAEQALDTIVELDLLAALRELADEPVFVGAEAT